ncbi:MAG: hypothetical protein IJY01_00525 [Clostridia bacterium]|nr:hypothetical protein [Clostridia bacterium]
MGDKVTIKEIELLYGRLFQIDLHNESKDEWYRVFIDKDELYKMLKESEGVE